MFYALLLHMMFPDGSQKLIHYQAELNHIWSPHLYFVKVAFFHLQLHVVPEINNLSGGSLDLYMNRHYELIIIHFLIMAS